MRSTGDVTSGRERGHVSTWNTQTHTVRIHHTLDRLHHHFLSCQVEKVSDDVKLLMLSVCGGEGGSD